MAEQTSISAYNNYKKAGLLNKNQAIVYETIAKNPYLTDKEYCELLGWPDSNRWKPRRTELLGKGLIESAGTKKCSITGYTATVWALATKDDRFIGEWIKC